MSVDLTGRDKRAILGWVLKINPYYIIVGKDKGRVQITYTTGENMRKQISILRIQVFWEHYQWTFIKKRTHERIMCEEP